MRSHVDFRLLMLFVLAASAVLAALPCRRGAPDITPAAPPVGLRGAARIALGRPIPVNTADVRSLTGVPGIGLRLALRLVQERQHGGPFRDPADLERVRGIGPALRARLTPLLEF